MKKWTLAVLLPLLLACGTAQAQDAEQEKSAEQEKRAGNEQAIVEHLLGMMNLPEKAREAREAGIGEKEIRQVMEETRRRGLSPRETGDILSESGKAARQNGEVDNFGSFVKEQLDRGLRGRDLADAIHEEHKMRGKGKGKGEGSGNRDGKGKGQGGQKGGKSNGKNK